MTNMLPFIVIYNVCNTVFVTMYTYFVGVILRSTAQYSACRCCVAVLLCCFVVVKK